MITSAEYREAQRKASEMIVRSGIKITEEEATNLEVVDFGLSDLKKEGAQILTFFSTQRVSVKVIALFPEQTEPEHWHPPHENDPGKEEVVRVVDGIVRFYIPGRENIRTGFIPQGKERYYTSRNEVILEPGDQIILEPGTKHWFQAGKEGAVMYCFSTCARDALDRFTDPNIARITKISD